MDKAIMNKFVLIPALLAGMIGYGQEPTGKKITDASFVFKGRVIASNATLTNEENVENSAIVQITELIEVPPALKGLTIKQVSVRFRNAGNVKLGTQRIFFTEPYYFGQDIGVEVISSYDTADSLFDSKNARKYIAQAKTAEYNREMKSLLASASLAVEGRVVSIRDVPYEKEGMTEHDPIWKEATVQVIDDLKGNNENKTVKILFPSSKDIMFVNTPKPRLNETGLFILSPMDQKMTDLFHLPNGHVLDANSKLIRQRAEIQKIKSL